MAEEKTTEVQRPQNETEQALVVSISPHVRSRESVPRIMWTVVACLIPSLILSAVLFGPRVLALTAISVLSCVGVEALCQKLMHRPIRIHDGSAVLTGLLLAYVLPPGVSFSLPIMGAVMAIFIGKQLMGGLGYNFFNPALLARAFLMVSFPAAMTAAWVMPTPLADLGAAGQWIAALNHIDSVSAATQAGVDALTGATPLALLTTQSIHAFHAAFGDGPGVYGQFFIGYKPGCIGEVSGLLLVLGGLFLMWKKYITWHIPVAMLGMIALLTWIFGGKELFSGDALLGVLSGGAILGAFFMATDYVTSPSNPMSKIIFGMAVGALTVLIRLKGGYPEGVCYAILLMNPLSTVFDGWFKRSRFAPAPAPKNADSKHEDKKLVDKKPENLTLPPLVSDNKEPVKSDVKTENSEKSAVANDSDKSEDIKESIQSEVKEDTKENSGNAMSSGAKS